MTCWFLPCARWRAPRPSCRVSGSDTTPGPLRRPARRFDTRKAVIGMRERMAAMKATLHTNQGDIVVSSSRTTRRRRSRTSSGSPPASREWTDPTTGARAPTPLYDGTDLPPRDQRIHDPGRRPAGHRHRRPGLRRSTTRSTPSSQFNKPYLLAMANAGKRIGKGTNGSQFFITVGPTPHLNGKHTIFGEVADGAEPRGRRHDRRAPDRRNDRPVEDVVIERSDRPRGLTGTRPIERTRSSSTMTDPTAYQARSTSPVCPRHPDRESHVRCQRCGRPACPGLPAARGGRDPVRRLRPPGGRRPCRRRGRSSAGRSTRAAPS